mmetsp:Transcript_13245/g.31367  ORF Transcript_13245/g.31367 Transcript_13245/m.31367 type:complete len:628 (+) Transcript_13245:75-1958(+)
MGQAHASSSLRSKHKDAGHDQVVEVDQVLARCGNRALITGRYTSSRRLEHDYHFDGKVIGSGMSGPVYLATGKADDCKYAIKSFKKKGMSSRKRAELKSEAEVYLSLDHPHVAKLEIIYETDEELHFVMEYMSGGELYKRLSSRKRYSEEAAALCIRQVLLAVAYLHARQVVHRDLKLENFLYESQDSDHLKLIDFGFAKFWNRDAKMSQACGSLHYVAPEVLEHSYTDKADIWSCGVIAYMLLTGAPPFFGSDEEVLTKIRMGQPHWSQRFHSLSPCAKDFVQKLLVADVNTRLSAKAALQHGFLSKSGREERFLEPGTLRSLRKFARASAFRRALLSIVALSLSNEDRNLLHEQFLAMDREKRGTITLLEMKSVLEENYHVDGAEAEALFSCLDTDNDDEIEYSEFLAAALIGRVQVHEDLLRKTFGRFDKSESGTITAENLRCVLGEHFEGAEMEELIREADVSGHGQIDYDEFLAYFYRADTDGLPKYSVLPPMGTQASVFSVMGKRAAQSDLGIYGKVPVGSTMMPPTFSVQSAPVSQEAWAKRKARTEKLGAVIDKLLSGATPSSEAHKIRRRSSEMPPTAEEPHPEPPKATLPANRRKSPLPTLLPPTSPTQARRFKAEL